MLAGVGERLFIAGLAREAPSNQLKLNVRAPWGPEVLEARASYWTQGIGAGRLPHGELAPHQGHIRFAVVRHGLTKGGDDIHRERLRKPHDPGPIEWRRSQLS